MRNFIFGAICTLLCAGGFAMAQQTMLQGPTWVVGDVPTYSAQNVNGNPLMVDSGLTPGSPLLAIVSTLPACSSTNKGQLYVVTDATSPTYGGALTGGSSTTALALCNGVSWVAH